MMKLNILIVNADTSQGAEWRSRLELSGYHVVAIQQDLSGMVFSISHEKIHIVLCASSLINNDAPVILRSLMEFFPRVKIVVVGNILLPHLLPKLTNVLIKTKFDCNLNGLFDFPDNEPIYRDKRDALHLLLGEHFLSSDEAAFVLEKIGSRWNPDFAVISVKTDSNPDFIIHILSEQEKKLPFCAAVKMNPHEICAVLDQSPSMQKCLEIADTLRTNILKRTDSSFSIGVSRSRAAADELFACRKESLRAAEAAHLYGSDSVIHINFLDDNDIWYAYPHHKERRLIECALDGDSAGALKLFDELVSFLEKRDGLRERYVNKIAMRIWSDLNLAASSRITAFETAQKDSLSFGKLLGVKSRQDAYQFLRDGIVSLSEEMREMVNVRRDVLFVKLSDMKYKGRQITVSELTKEFHTTISFLNDAIKTNSKNNIFDFFLKE